MWVITPSWLSESWRSFLYSSVYSCYLFLTSSASVRSIPFCPLLSSCCMNCSLGNTNLLEEISSVSNSIVFLYFFALITDLLKSSMSSYFDKGHWIDCRGHSANGKFFQYKRVGTVIQIAQGWKIHDKELHSFMDHSQLKLKFKKCEHNVTNLFFTFSM